MDLDIQPALDAIANIKPRHYWLIAEIGSKHGDVAKYLYQQYACSVIAMEPSIDAYKGLVRNIIGTPIRTAFGALWKDNCNVMYGEVESIDGELGGNVVGWNPYRILQRYDVPGITWDTFISNYCRGVTPDLVFSDCEGSEQHLLRQILQSNFKPHHIIVEWHPAFYGKGVRNNLITQMEVQYNHETIYYIPDKVNKHPLYGRFEIRV